MPVRVLCDCRYFKRFNEAKSSEVAQAWSTASAKAHTSPVCSSAGPVPEGYPKEGRRPEILSVVGKCVAMQVNP